MKSSFVDPDEAHAHARVRRVQSREERNQILRTVVFAVTRPGGECSAGASREDDAVVWVRTGVGTIQAMTAQSRLIDAVFAASCGCLSVRTSVRQQPDFAIAPQLPCMARQQAFSSWPMAAPVMQASTGAAVETMSRSATMPARRRIMTKVYASAHPILSAGGFSWLGRTWNESVTWDQ